MTDAPALFLACCADVLAEDETVIERLQRAGFDCKTDGWSFTLPALHAFLVDQHGMLLDYKSFVQQLFASDINLRLRAQGAEIAIADNRGKVNASRYRLRRLNA
ncbi:hypothetical protein [Pseudomonas sp. LRF_L74]|uniref:hypothetical protein n=1 Tax=Pseudomonas sp. LRF_L74 TaxID=3369422 RepID=UPI003F60E136